MSKKSNDQGRAYEYICLLTLHEAISGIRRAQIIENSSYSVAERAWDTLTGAEKTLYQPSAQSIIETIFALEPNIVEADDDTLNLYIQKDDRGETADARDIIIERKDVRWEIGLSIKHNHMAVKHSRLSHELDFGEKWYGVPCSADYWNRVMPVFDYLRQEKEKCVLFRDLPSKQDDVYMPVLNAFMDEVRMQINKDNTIPKKLVEYLLSKFDFYKIISIDSKRVTTIQSFNMYGTLNLPAKKTKATPQLKAQIINQPTTLLHAGFKPGSDTTVIMCFDKGWQFSFRIHNAEKIASPTLKFDIQIDGIPANINMMYNCKW